jgi:uroporphyrinogen-III decarboxylase
MKSKERLQKEDTSTTNINPAYYEKYILPEINGWCDILHGEGKKYIQHACGHLKHLLPLLGGSKIDGIESVSPPLRVILSSPISETIFLKKSP